MRIKNTYPGTPIATRSKRAKRLKKRANSRHCRKFPNKETRKEIAGIERGKNLIEAKDLDDLFKKLGIL